MLDDFGMLIDVTAVTNNSKHLSRLDNIILQDRTTRNSVKRPESA
jgi:hypothetical protein